MNTDHDWKRGFRTTPVDLAARISAARDAGLPITIAARLLGDTEDDIRADAAALANALNNVPQEDNDMTNTTEPTQATEETPPPADIDEVELHRSAMAGRPAKPNATPTPDTAADPLELHRNITRNY